MAGHNKWSKVKHRKAVVDKRRSKVWSKVSRAIIVAARHGGGDPNFNLPLRYAIDEARYANMPRDVIDRAVQKGAGGGDMSAYENVRYEGYAPGGVAVIIDALTDNRTRTATDVRNAFNDNGGNLGTGGCVAYLFAARGRIGVKAAGVTEDAIVEASLQAGALDVLSPDDAGDEDAEWTVLTDVPAYHSVRDALEKGGFTLGECELGMLPEQWIAVRGEHAKQVMDLVEQLEDLDDVQKVYTNAEIADEPTER
ncbi:MAG: YebC/PmpR family DNA-binding transcriptional regulator [Planctomycetota bacterium]|nr:YebC/PmpR family DNA-binding transcriptional regulator [Planctomycetota bacterium]